MEEYKEAKEMMLDIGRQILLKVDMSSQRQKQRQQQQRQRQRQMLNMVRQILLKIRMIPFIKAKNTRWCGEPQIAPEVIFEVILYNIC